MDRNCGYGSVPHLALVGSYLGSAMAYNGQPQARPLIAAFCGLPCVLCLVYLNSKFFMLKVFYSMSCIILFRVRSSILTSSCYCKVSCKVCVFSFFFVPPHYFLSMEHTESLLVLDLFYGELKAFQTCISFLVWERQLCVGPGCLYRWESIWAEENSSE